MELMELMVFRGVSGFFLGGVRHRTSPTVTAVTAVYPITTLP